MFGHHDDQSAHQAADATADEPVDTALSTDDAAADQSPKTEPAAPDNIVKPDVKPDDSSEPDKKSPEETNPESSPSTPDSPDSNDQPWQHPGAPLKNENGHEHISDVISPAGGFPKRPSYQYPVGVSPSDNSGISSDSPIIHDLIDIKQQALGELAPLLDQLDLPPEEKFRTIMMIIQASDDQTLVKAAYAAAHSIEDKKAHAQALLDIVNEVNYFTQQPETDQ